MGSSGKNALRPWWRLAEGAGEPGADPTLPLTTASSPPAVAPSRWARERWREGGRVLAWNGCRWPRGDIFCPEASLGPQSSPTSLVCAVILGILLKCRF